RFHVLRVALRPRALHLLIFYYLPVRTAPRSTLFPYTTLFRSRCRSRRTGDRSPTPARSDRRADRRTGQGGTPRTADCRPGDRGQDRKSTRLNSSHDQISYAVFCLKKKTTTLLRIYEIVCLADY